MDRLAQQYVLIYICQSKTNSLLLTTKTNRVAIALSAIKVIVYLCFYLFPRSAYGNLAVNGTNLVVQRKCCNV